MKISNQCYVAISRFEGCNLKAYKCSGGVWTIGYGHTAGVKQGDTISYKQASDYFREDIEAVERQLSAYSHLTSGQWDALVSFVFNVGYGNFAKSTLKMLIDDNPNDKRIADEFRRWVYAGGVRLDGLVKRREWEAKRYYE